jgi:hypothetical protein
MSSSRCILEFAYSAKLLTLNTAGVVRITFDLLFATCYASDCESFPGLASLGDTPMGIHCLSIDNCFAMATIVVKVAHPLSRYFGGPYKSRKKVCSGPNLRTQPIL